MLATRWNGTDPTGWLMSEKLDGIRMIRQAGQTVFLSRKGVPFNPPLWWVKQLPAYGFLDGEAWLGRGRFQETQSILERPVPVDDEWRQVMLMVIEPLALGLEGKYALVHRWLMPPADTQEIPVGRLIKQEVCKGYDHLRQAFDQVVALGGEGIILRHPTQPYHCGRSPWLLKVKPEVKGVATVLDYNMDHGALVSLQCKWGDVEFRLANGLTEELRAHPPLAGSQVKFQYQCLTDRGIPRMAKLAK